MTARLGRPLIAFGLLASAVYVAAVLVVVPALPTVPDAGPLAFGLAVDLVILVPVLFAVLVARRTRQWLTLVPVVVLSVRGAWWVLPEAYRGVLDPLVAVLPIAIVGVIVGVAAAFVRALRRADLDDVSDRFQAAATRVLGEGRGAHALASELAMVRYALGPLAPPAEGAFPFRRSSGYGSVLAGIGVAAALELVGGHLLIQHIWGGTAALVHLALSLYGILWLAADWRAMGARVTTLDGNTLRVRCGLRWRVDVPAGIIETVYHVRRDLPKDRPTVVATPGTPRFALDLRQPVIAVGPYGIRREVTRVALSADDPDRFLKEIAEAMDAPLAPGPHDSGAQASGRPRS
ncbi:MAG: hypothetical protein AAGK21_14170 [Bacteroidota bacterium]